MELFDPLCSQTTATAMPQLQRKVEAESPKQSPQSQKNIVIPMKITQSLPNTFKQKKVLMPEENQDGIYTRSPPQRSFHTQYDEYQQQPVNNNYTLIPKIGKHDEKGIVPPKFPRNRGWKEGRTDRIVRINPHSFPKTASHIDYIRSFIPE